MTLKGITGSNFPIQGVKSIYNSMFGSVKNGVCPQEASLNVIPSDYIEEDATLT